MAPRRDRLTAVHSSRAVARKPLTICWLDVGGPNGSQLEPRRAVDGATREPEASIMSPGFAQGFVRVSQ